MKDNGSKYCVCIAGGKVELVISRVKMRARVDLERSYWQAWRYRSLQTGEVAQQLSKELNIFNVVSMAKMSKSSFCT